MPFAIANDTGARSQPPNSTWFERQSKRWEEQIDGARRRPSLRKSVKSDCKYTLGQRICPFVKSPGSVCALSGNVKLRLSESFKGVARAHLLASTIRLGLFLSFSA